jgi:signal transduction histidine kinase
MTGGDRGWLARLAHDLRGPLAPLQTASYLLQREDLDPARRQELLALVDRQVRRMGRMLDELDDWTRAGDGRLLGESEPVELALPLDYALVGAGVRDARVEDDGNIALVQGDPQRLTQLLRTLVDFALAHATLGAVSLRSGDGRAELDLVVPGQADAAATLFDIPQRQPYDDGLGFRFGLARAIARAHGGDLVAEPVPGGLRLRCTLPTIDAPQG